MRACHSKRFAEGEVNFVRLVASKRLQPPQIILCQGLCRGAFFFPPATSVCAVGQQSKRSGRQTCCLQHKLPQTRPV